MDFQRLPFRLSAPIFTMTTLLLGLFISILPSFSLAYNNNVISVDYHYHLCGVYNPTDFPLFLNKNLCLNQAQEGETTI